VIAPFAAIVLDDERPVAGLAARLELRRLDTGLGYKVLYAPQVRYLRVVNGGIAARTFEELGLLRDAVERLLAAGDADVAAFPALEVGSAQLAVFAAIGGRLERQPFSSAWTRRRLLLPASFEEFIATRSANTRWRIRRDARRIQETFGPDLAVEIVRSPAGVDRFVTDADLVSRATYQRGLGAGFSATDEQRTLLQVGLDHGWARGYLLYVSARPAAFWLCSIYGDTIVIEKTGFDKVYAEYRIGLHLLMRVIEDACADPTLHVLDFGPGDAAYKLQFSNASHSERQVVVFAPTARTRRINATRAAILGSERAARRLLDATDLTERIRARWRHRLRA
jgi:Acetyltransferase (GNAT) domain